MEKKEQKSLYEMTQEELNDLSPADFNEAYIKANAPLVESWAKTPWLKDERGPAWRGANVNERDYAKATCARVLQNYVDSYLGFKGKDGRGNQQSRSVEEAVKIMERYMPEDHMLPQTDIMLGEAGATTSAWSGATTLPIVLGYARKIMPKLYAQEFYAVQALDRPTGRVFYITRNRDNNGSADGQIEQRAGWSYRSWVDDPGEDTSITKGVNFSITSADVTAKSRKLKGQTSIEVEQDLRAYFGMDAVALVSDEATDEIAVEIDEELAYNLYRRGSVNGVGTFQYGLTVPSAMTQEAYDKRIYEILTRASVGVFSQKRVYPNWVLGGTDWQVQTAIPSVYIATHDEIPMRTMISPAGQLLGAFNFYVASLPWPTSEAIMGFKGRDYVDASAFFLPYLPVTLAGVLFDPSTQQRTMSWLTRYAIFNNAFSGQKENYAYLKIVGGFTGLSYPAPVEYL